MTVQSKSGHYLDENNRVVRLGAAIGKGGEGVVHEVVTAPETVAKIWHHADQSIEAAHKVAAMRHRPPRPSARDLYRIIWPGSILKNPDTGTPAGYLMPRLQLSIWEPVLKYYTPRLARQIAEGRRIPVTMALRNAMAYNICSAVAAIHEAGYIIGDINENNILADPTGRIAIIDCDAFQVRHRSGVFTARKVRPEFQPPELQGRPGADVIRDESHDAFALGVLLFKLLCQGVHPYDGSVVDELFHPGYTTQEARIKDGIFYPVRPDVVAASDRWQRQWDALNPPTQARFIHTFTTAQRATPEGWLPALAQPQQDEGQQTIAPGQSATTSRSSPAAQARTHCVVVTAVAGQSAHWIDIFDSRYEAESQLRQSLTEPWKIIWTSPPGTMVEAETFRRHLQQLLADGDRERYRQLTGYDPGYRPPGTLRFPSWKLPLRPPFTLPAISRISGALWRRTRTRRALTTAAALAAVAVAGLVGAGIYQYAGGADAQTPDAYQAAPSPNNDTPQPGAAVALAWQSLAGARTDRDNSDYASCITRSDAAAKAVKPFATTNPDAARAYAAGVTAWVDCQHSAGNQESPRLAAEAIAIVEATPGQYPGLTEQLAQIAASGQPKPGLVPTPAPTDTPQSTPTATLAPAPELAATPTAITPATPTPAPTAVPVPTATPEPTATPVPTPTVYPDPVLLRQRGPPPSEIGTGDNELVSGCFVGSHSRTADYIFLADWPNRALKQANGAVIVELARPQLVDPGRCYFLHPAKYRGADEFKHCPGTPYSPNGCSANQLIHGSYHVYWTEATLHDIALFTR